MFESLAAAGEFGDNGIDGRGPDEGLWIFVPSREELLNGGDEIGNIEK